MTGVSLRPEWPPCSQPPTPGRICCCQVCKEVFASRAICPNENSLPPTPPKVTKPKMSAALPAGDFFCVLSFLFHITLPLYLIQQGWSSLLAGPVVLHKGAETGSWASRSLAKTKICRCSSPVEKTAQYLQIIYAILLYILNRL